MSNFNLKAKNKKTGEIVEFEVNFTSKGNMYSRQLKPTRGYINYYEDEFNELYEVVEDNPFINQLKKDLEPNHPYGGMEVGNFDHEIMINGSNIIEAKDNLTKDINNLVNKLVKQELERISKNFMTEFTDPDTGLLDIGKYDHERIIKFFNQEIK